MTIIYILYYILTQIFHSKLQSVKYHEAFSSMHFHTANIFLIFQLNALTICFNNCKTL